MKLRIFSSQREPGFRLNLVDIALGAAMAGASYGLANTAISELAPLPLHAYFTFFLFCNVFRIGRKQEVVWWLAALSVLVFRILSGEPPYPFAFAVTVPLAATCVVWSALAGKYNGVGQAAVTAFRDRAR